MGNPTSGHFTSSCRQSRTPHGRTGGKASDLWRFWPNNYTFPVPHFSNIVLGIWEFANLQNKRIFRCPNLPPIINQSLMRWKSPQRAFLIQPGWPLRSHLRPGKNLGDLCTEVSWRVVSSGQALLYLIIFFKFLELRRCPRCFLNFMKWVNCFFRCPRMCF